MRRPNRRRGGAAARTRAQRANDAAAAAQAEAGTKQSDAIVAGCDLVRIGVFFDGTGNFRGNTDAGVADSSWHTNVDLLEEVYPTFSGTVPVGGVDREVVYDKLYMRGIGIEADGSNADWGRGTGMGGEGVDARSDQAIEQASAAVRSAMAQVQPCEIWFDVFGFSRGATAARDFANAVRDGDSDDAASTFRPHSRRGRVRVKAGPKPKVKFMGLFDTVSSVGLFGGETDGDAWVDLTSPGRAEHILHITAADEFRENFPLTRAAGREIAMVGAHGDIGGGYHPGLARNTLTYEARPYEGVTARLLRDWGVTLNGPTTAGGERLTGRSETRYLPSYGYAPPTRIEVEMREFSWQARHGLQFVALRLMYDEAVRRGVPFPPQMPSSIDGKSVALDGLLAQYHAAIVAGSVGPALEDAVRQAYCHFSANNATALRGTISPFLPERDGERTAQML